MRTNLYRSPDLFCSHGLDENPNPSGFHMHTHLFGELFCFLQGSAVFHVEGTQYPLEPGDILLMRPTEAHYIEITPSVPYERIVINFDPELFYSIEPDNQLLRPFYDRDAGKQNLYRVKDFEDAQYMEYLRDLSVHKDSRLATLADLILLLTQINISFGTMNREDSFPDTLENRILRHINNNLGEPLSLEYLCDRYFVSRAQLCRRFQKATGTSVGKYITAKRLISAQQLILKGYKPTEIYSICGFRDYSTFYRAYFKYFGHSPKNESQYLYNAEDGYQHTI